MEMPVPGERQQFDGRKEDKLRNEKSVVVGGASQIIQCATYHAVSNVTNEMMEKQIEVSNQLVCRCHSCNAPMPHSSKSIATYHAVSNENWSCVTESSMPSGMMAKPISKMPIDMIWRKIATEANHKKF